MTSLYIHIPFCPCKCFYCSFNIVVAQEHRIDSYLEALAQEARFYQNTFIDTIYIGGGTPSLLKKGQLVRLIEIVRENFLFENDCELTLEANPSTFDDSKAKLFFELGVNRISLGIQSFNDGFLRFLGRSHNSKDGRKAYSLLRQANFSNINVDMIYSLPQQTDEDLRRDVQQMTALESDHLSLYALTVEEKTRFFAKKLELANSALRTDQYQLVVHLLEKAGFYQYEVSNFSREGMESRHNRNYWQGGNYIGLGVGAHSHIDGKRYWNISHLMSYIQRLANHQTVVEGEEYLTSHERLMETFLFGLRMNRGVDIGEIERRYGCPLGAEKIKLIEEFIKGGFLEINGSFLRTTLAGRLVLDELATRLV